ncbi:hypothetical protein O9G_003547 [Rozella allomycis CSF55]|uniref:Uncharacterized protein n=1 Tax=Rozella allomycis (strain CSF55) TaxID=988480 RepID=A0A075B3Z9_ROZAC|nr:hypothetical protein O9G_003547 [Rozella allomycis CSF55]|eukprot:EPZ35902.1 hypothetical protein O9G_003547 [Rozella allomycis CSF55]
MIEGLKALIEKKEHQSAKDIFIRIFTMAKKYDYNISAFENDLVNAASALPASIDTNEAYKTIAQSWINAADFKKASEAIVNVKDSYNLLAPHIDSIEIDLIIEIILKYLLFVDFRRYTCNQNLNDAYMLTRLALSKFPINDTLSSDDMVLSSSSQPLLNFAQLFLLCIERNNVAQLKSVINHYSQEIENKKWKALVTSIGHKYFSINLFPNAANQFACIPLTVVKLKNIMKSNERINQFKVYSGISGITSMSLMALNEVQNTHSVESNINLDERNELQQVRAEVEEVMFPEFPFVPRKNDVRSYTNFQSKKVKEVTDIIKEIESKKKSIEDDIIVSQLGQSPGKDVLGFLDIKSLEEELIPEDFRPKYIKLDSEDETPEPNFEILSESDIDNGFLPLIDQHRIPIGSDLSNGFKNFKPPVQVQKINLSHKVTARRSTIAITKRQLTRLNSSISISERIERLRSSGDFGSAIFEAMNVSYVPKRSKILEVMHGHYEERQDKNKRIFMEKLSEYEKIKTSMPMLKLDDKTIKEIQPNTDEIIETSKIDYENYDVPGTPPSSPVVDEETLDDNDASTVSDKKITKNNTFLIANGKVIESLPPFIAFKQKNIQKWGPLLCIIQDMEKLLTKYSVPLCQVDCKKLEMLAARFWMEKPTDKHLISTFVEKIIRTPGNLYKSNDRDNNALLKIQATWRMYKCRQ